MLYSHDRAGVAPLFAALTDQKRPRSFTLKHLLGLRPAQFTNKPVCLVLMWQVLLVSLQHVCAGKKQEWYCEMSVFHLEDALLNIVE